MISRMYKMFYSLGPESSLHYCLLSVQTGPENDRLEIICLTLGRDPDCLGILGSGFLGRLGRESRKDLILVK